MIVELEGLQLRSLRREDLETIRQGREACWRTLGDPWPVNELQQEKWFEALSGKRDEVFFVAELARDRGMEIIEKSKRCYMQSNGSAEPLPASPIGYGRIHDISWIDRTGMVTYCVFPAHQGQGWGTKLMILLLDYAFYHLGLERIWAFVIEDNGAALHVDTKLGFREEGRLRKHYFRGGEWKDAILLGMLLEEWEERLNE